VLYPNFTILFNSAGKSYTTSNGDALFESTGTWEFVGGSYDKIKLSGTKLASGVDISYTRTNNLLVLKFTINAPPNGRIDALVGNYEIKLLVN
jgi:hypothetical protein